ncbi:DUF1826 domain-containing protein [Maricaulis sp.]|uniref:DUF1826 domain-containing protein n=1 Tax=Maricaulis sp. TaxID=1486257 RepID=UPI0025BCCBB4|nr:DUF1826 domain-containing protein [Maricaulis sp.]
MSTPTPDTKMRADALLPVTSMGEFAPLLERGAEGLIWGRELPSSVAVEMQSWNMAGAVPERFLSDAGGIRRHVDAILESWSGLSHNSREWLATDIAELGMAMARLLSTDTLMVRVEPVRDDACRRFHKDVVKARLICTYKGPGTEYGFADQDHDQPLTAGSVPTGAPIILRGKRWPNNAETELLHRSPVIEARGESRFLVVINEAPTSAS